MSSKRPHFGFTRIRKPKRRKKDKRSYAALASSEIQHQPPEPEAAR